MAMHGLRARCLFPTHFSQRPLQWRPHCLKQCASRIYPRFSSSSASPLPVSRLRLIVVASAILTSATLAAFYATDTRSSLHHYVVPPLIRLVYPDAEDAHHSMVESLKALYLLGLHPRDRTDNGPSLALTVLGERLENPIGISAGLDKDADIPDALFALGASVVEVGGCTPLPQPGNLRPRVFRVPSIDGLINRYGLNSIGADALAARLHARLHAFCKARNIDETAVLSGAAGVPPGSLSPGRLLLVQIAKNKETDEHDVAAVARDYTYCVRRLAPYADVLVVNVSSPNTPGLRDLQAIGPLTEILTAVVKEARQCASPSAKDPLLPSRARPPRIMVKVSPDEDEEEQVRGICEAVITSGVDGIIVGNTTKRRSGLVPPSIKLSLEEKQALAEIGGFSGTAMFPRTLELVKLYRKTLDEQALHGDGATTSPVPAKTLFASGGVNSGSDALKLLEAGASLAMIYTGLVYGGAGTITRCKDEMRELIALS